MVHTDGRPTIANAPARVVDHVVDGFTPDPDKVLLERHFAGLDVYVSHDLETGLNVLSVRRAGDEAFQVALIPADKLLDAFEHPFRGCYLP